MEMLCLMHEDGEPYGHLRIWGKALGVKDLARLIGEPVKTVENWMAELESAGVFSRTAEGTIYSRRMVRDEQMRMQTVESGRSGGNPALVGEYHEPGMIYVVSDGQGHYKIGASKQPAKRLYKLKQSTRNDRLFVCAQLPVDDMGRSEGLLHANFAQYQNSGEWFDFPPDVASALIAAIQEDRLSDLLSVPLKGNLEIPLDLPHKGNSHKSTESEDQRSEVQKGESREDLGGGPGEGPQDPPSGRESRSSQPLERIDFTLFSEQWNDLARQIGTPIFEVWTESRKRHLRARLKEPRTFDWRRILDKARGARGAHGKRWFTLEWLIKSPDNVAKLLEGKYDEPFGETSAASGPQVQPPPPSKRPPVHTVNDERPEWQPPGWKAQANGER